MKKYFIMFITKMFALISTYNSIEKNGKYVIVRTYTLFLIYYKK